MNGTFSPMNLNHEAEGALPDVGESGAHLGQEVHGGTAHQDGARRRMPPTGNESGIPARDSDRISRVQVTNTVTPVATPTISRANDPRVAADVTGVGQAVLPPQPLPAGIGCRRPQSERMTDEEHQLVTDLAAGGVGQVEQRQLGGLVEPGSFLARRIPQDDERKHNHRDAEDQVRDHIGGERRRDEADADADRHEDEHEGGEQRRAEVDPLADAAPTAARTSVRGRAVSSSR